MHPCMCVCVQAICVCVIIVSSVCVLAVYNAQAQRISSHEFKLWTFLQGTQSIVATFLDETCVISHQSLANMYVCVCVCVCLSLSLSVCVCLNVAFLYINIYIYIYICMHDCMSLSTKGHLNIQFSILINQRNHTYPSIYVVPECIHI